MLGESFENRESHDEAIEARLLNLARKIEAPAEALDDLTRAILMGTAAELERRAVREARKTLKNVRVNDPHLTFRAGSTDFDIQCWQEQGKKYPTIQLLKPTGLPAYDAGTKLGDFKTAVVERIKTAK